MGKLTFYARDIALGVGIFSIPFLVPIFQVNADMGTLVSATSAVFAIVSGFFIADAMSNYLRLQTLISEENAALISLADNAKKIDSQHSPAVIKAIDEYMIAQLDAETLNHIIHTDAQIDALDASIDALHIDAGDSEVYDHVLGMREKIRSARQEILLAAKKNLTIGHWVTLIVLGALVAFTVLATRDGGLFLNVVAGSMMVGMQAILVLLRDMDNNHLLEMKLGYDNPREVFHALGVPPYYPHSSPPICHKPDVHGTYRLGKESGGLAGYEVISTR